MLEFMTASKVSEVLNFSYSEKSEEKLCFLKAQGFLDDNWLYFLQVDTVASYTIAKTVT